jgi:hypothetical protein
MDPELKALWQAYRQAWAAWESAIRDREARRSLWDKVNLAADAIELAEIERGLIEPPPRPD